MIQSLADQRLEVQPSKNLESPFFDSRLPAISRVVVLLDRQVPLRSLKIDSDIDDTNCACG